MLFGWANQEYAARLVSSSRAAGYHESDAPTDQWVVLDAGTVPKPGRPNEDAFGVAGHVAWIVDGASGLDPRGKDAPRAFA